MSATWTGINYDAHGWFTDPSRTGDYTGLCCVVVTSPPGVTVYWLVETDCGWGRGLSSHAKPQPEPRR